MLHALDLGLCIVYLISVIFVGLFFTYREQKERQRRAKAEAQAKEKGNECLEEYYLGGRKIPWWALGIADVSSYIDISGTMINTALVYALGIKGMYIEIRGGLCLFLAFQLAYTGKLSRRCPVKTRGEWIKFRFGNRRDGIILRTCIACTSLMNSILSVTYFAVGGGKFVTEFIDVPEYLGLPSEFWAASLLMLIAILYTVVSGFTTVVYTDVYQSVFIFSSFLIVGLMGLSVTLPSHFFVYLPYLPPSGYNHTTMLEINVTRTEWSSAFPPNSLNLPPEATYSMYNSFQAIIATYLLLQCTRSASGPGGSGLQTVLATKSEKEVRSQTFLAMMLLTLRWVFSGGVAVLGIQLTLDHGGLVIDPERVVPIVIDKVLPIGIKGFVLASLLAAALTTFDTTINAASAYWTVDIYQALINPRASDRKLLLQARLSTVIVMLFGVLISLQVNTINRIWGFMTIAMAGGFVWPFFFSWYWARFNAYGCFFGIASGFIAAISIFIFDPLLPEIHAFFITCSTSGLISISICLLTPPVSNQIQRRFYRFARPPGMWKEIKTMCFSSKEIQDINHENRTDLACTFLIGITQLAAYLFAVSFVSKAWIQAGILVVILATTSPIIYFKWYLKLADQPTGGLVKNDLHEDLLFS